MKIFIKKSILVLVLIVVVSIILNVVVYPILNLTPWSWGSDILHQKANHINKSNTKYNTLFIGSSRIYSHINPAILDSITKPKHEISSYNFGVNSLFVPETFYVYDQLVKENKGQFKNVIIELSKIRSVDFENLHTIRTFYWYNKSNYIFSVRAILGSNFSIPERGYLIFIHTISYIDELLNLGYITEAMRFNSEEIINEKINKQHGFVPLVIDHDELLNDTEERNSVKRNNAFLNDTSIVTKRMVISKEKFQEYEDHPEKLNKYNRYYAEQIEAMIEEANENGIHIYFLLAPRIDSKQYDELIPLFNQININHRIEISDARKYPELYLAENSFDETHLNSKGANIYSEILAKKLNNFNHE